MKEHDMAQNFDRDDLILSNEGSNYGREARRGGKTFDRIKVTVADKLKQAADALQQKTAQTGEQTSAVGSYGNQAAGWLNSSADYIRDMEPQQVKSDIQNEVRRNPGRSLLIAGAAGLILGALFRRR
jgi:ElaB/YqjD/DUF883 family membrane-anchored ribosome-binding protein